MTHDADKRLVWLSGEVKSPPFSRAARLEAGFLLRRLQRGEKLEPPHSRAMSSIGKRCHELRVPDAGVTWRMIYRIDADAIVLTEVFAKKTARTPKRIIRNCRRRLKRYDQITRASQ
ncbi:MAG: type II toxin-antitoxin system RelE/ParE family toxin [Gemmatimonadota bacterium]